MAAQPENTIPSSHRFLPWLLLLFAASGCAALIYEIVWFQLLQLVVGSSAVSLAVLLGTFMGGMCLGSLLLPRWIPSQSHPLRVYALLELGIGICGLAVLFGLPHIAKIYIANAAQGFVGILFRGMVCGICLLPPTFLMGATLPSIARWLEGTPSGAGWLGFFYGGNIAGAVLGSLLAGFYLLRIYDMRMATYLAAILNVLIAVIATVLASKAKTLALKNEEPSNNQLRKSNDWAVYLTIGLSGLTALASEVIWTRLLSLTLGATVYTFSIILAVFLAGLGIGSGVGAFLARGVLRPRLLLGCCQLLLTAAIGWTAYMIARSLPYWPIQPSLAKSPWIGFQLDLARCFWGVLPPTCFWGASFPLALASLSEKDSSRAVGQLYAANTVGGIIGALAASLWLIQWIGTQQAQRLLIILITISATLIFLIPSSANEPRAFGSKIGKAWLLVACICSGLFFTWTVPGIPWGLVAHGRALPARDGEGNILYMGEGMNASVAVRELVSGVKTFHVSGKVEASTDSRDMRLQRMLGHIPALFNSQPRSVLIVGCGAGVTAGCFVLHPSIEKIVICEIEPLIPRVVAEYFARENYNVVKDPRVKIVYDDARHFILTTHDKFDIITSDPIHPWVKGAATLYTREYFESCKRRLNPGGVVTQWVPLYESNLAAVKSAVATFFNTFPNGTIWSNDDDGEGYDVVLLGQEAGGTINVDDLQGRLDREKPVAKSLAEVGFNSAVALVSTYAGRPRDLTGWLADAEINHDRNLRLQYLAGLGVNLNQAGFIYSDMISYRKYPEDLFIASDEPRHALRKALRLRAALP